MPPRFACGALALVALLVGCDRLPQSHHITPELTGRLMRSGVPVVDASIIVGRRPVSDAPEDACRDDLTTTRTDSAGAFIARAYRTWMRAQVAEKAERAGEKFELCVKPKGSSEYRLLFRGVANRWDSMILDCDLVRDWLAPDDHGSAGRCVVSRFGLEGVSVGQRPTRPAALKCDTATTLLEPTSIGPIRRAGYVDELRRLCVRLRDTVTVDHAVMDDGSEEQLLVLDIGGQPVVIRKSAHPSMVVHMWVSSPVFRTADGFGVGTPVTSLLEKPDLKLAFNPETMEPFFYAWHGDVCGIGYAILPPPGFRGHPGGMVDTSLIREWPATMDIDRVYAGYCPTFLNIEPEN